MDPAELKRLQELERQLEKISLSDPGDGSGFRWVLEDRLRYKNMHREKDLALLREQWTVHVAEEIAAAAAAPTSGTSSSTTTLILRTAHKNDTDAKTKKKYEKVIKVSRALWRHELDAMGELFDNPNYEEGSKLAMAAGMAVLNKMENALPKYKGNVVIVDVTRKCLQSEAAWEKETADGMTIL
jgi:hypothetical protein